MDIKQLHYFSTIVQEGQITRAAKKLHMAQPPLSQQLKLLEEELGVLLFYRKGKSLELTEAGKYLYEKSLGILQEMQDIHTEVKEIDDGIKGQLAIGSVKTSFSFAAEKMNTFREKFPSISFRLYEGDSYQLANHVRNRIIDLAIVRLPLDLSDFHSISLPSDEFVLIVPENWMWNDKVKLSTIKDYPLMLLHRIKGIGLYELVINEWEKNGYTPNVVCQCSDAAMLLSLVKAGVGFTMLPRSTFYSFPINGLKMLEVVDLSIETKTNLIWLKDSYLSKKAMIFIELFVNEQENSQQ